MNLHLTLPQKIAALFTVALFVYWAILFGSNTTEGFHNFFYSFLFGLTPLIGGIVAVFNAKVWGGLKTAIGSAIFFVGFGMFLWGGGELIWSYYNFFLGEPAPYPSFADIGFAPSIFFYGIGALYLSKVTGARFGLRSKLAKIGLLLTVLIVLPLSWYILVVLARGGVLIPPGETPLKVILDIVYPLGSFFALLVAIIISGFSFKYMGGKYTFSIVMLILGLFAMFVGDTMFSYTTTVGTYYNANFGDLILTTGTFLLTFGILGFYRYPEPLQEQVIGNSGERVYNRIAESIVKEQELLMGPVAWYEAEKVPGLQVVKKDEEESVTIASDVDGMVALDNLVDAYRKLFGPAAVEVSRDAASVYIADIDQTQIPSSLRA
jgi:hypothetical protein